MVLNWLPLIGRQLIFLFWASFSNLNMYPDGLYEQLIKRLVISRLNDLDKDKYYIKESTIDKGEAAQLLSQYLADVIRIALSLITDSHEGSVHKQIDLSNKIILLLQSELKRQDFDE